MLCASLSKLHFCGKTVDFVQVKYLFIGLENGYIFTAISTHSVDGYMLSTGRVMIDIHLYCLFKYLCCCQFVHTSCSPEHSPPSPIMSKQSAVKRLFMRGSFTGTLSDGVDCVATLLLLCCSLLMLSKGLQFWRRWFNIFH